MTFNLVFLKDDMTFEEFEDRRVILPCCFEVETDLYFADASNCFSFTDEIFKLYCEELSECFTESDYRDSFRNDKNWCDSARKNMLLPIVESYLLDSGIANYSGEIWGDEISATRVYTGLSAYRDIIYCIQHYSLTNGYSPAVCEHCGEPFLRKHKNTKFCTRYSPLQGYTDKQCGDAANNAKSTLKERLDYQDHLLRGRHYNDNKRIEANNAKIDRISELRGKYLNTDYTNLEKLKKILDEEFPKYNRNVDIIPIAKEV